MVNKTLTSRLKAKYGKMIEAHESSEGVVILGKDWELYVHAQGKSMKTTGFYQRVEKEVSAYLG